jgi:hypothetical protein
MNAKATLLMLVLVPFALGAHPLSANDDKKKNSTSPPPSARPQNSTAPRATSKAPNASAKAPSNRPGTTAGAVHPQTGRATATSPPPSARPQNGTAPRAASKAPNASAKAPSNRPGTTASAIHAQPGRAPAPASQRPVNRAQLQQRMSVHPSQQDRVHAHESYKIERAHFTRHMDPIRFAPEHRLILTRMHVVPGTYYYRRNAFYDTYGWVNPPYVYRMYPRYGLWDATFLAFALHHLAEEQYAMMFYNHWADPEMQRWVRDTNGFAAHDAELRAQVAAMNDRVSRLENSGTARDASYVPADAQDVALSPDAVDQLTSK